MISDPTPPIYQTTTFRCGDKVLECDTEMLDAMPAFGKPPLFFANITVPHQELGGIRVRVPFFGCVEASDAFDRFGEYLADNAPQAIKDEAARMMENHRRIQFAQAGKVHVPGVR